MDRIPLVSAALLFIAVELSAQVIPVHPAAADVQVQGHALAYNEIAGNYLSVVAVRTGTSSYAYSLRTVVIDASTGQASAPVSLVPGSVPAFAPAIAWNSSRNRHLVVFTAPDAETGYSQVMALPVDAQGRAVAPAIQVSAEAEGAESPRVACDGAGWFVAWTAGPMDDLNLLAAVRGRRVDGGFTGDPSGLGATIDFASRDDDRGLDRVKVAALPGRGFLVAWMHREEEERFDCEGCTVSATGQAGQVRVLATDVLGGFDLAAGRDGWLLGWGSYGLSNIGVRLRRVDESGAAAGAAGMLREPRTGRGAPTIELSSFRLIWNAPSSRFLAAWLEGPGTACSFLAAVVDESGTTGGTPISLLTATVSRTARLDVATPEFADSNVLIQWDEGALSAVVHGPAGIAAPDAPQAGQFSRSGATIAPAGVVNQGAFVVRAPLVDANGDAVRLEVEVKAAGTAFSGTPIHSSPQLPSGSAASVTVTLPEFALGRSYHWRARTVDAGGAVSRWVGFGSDPEEADEIDLAVRSTNAIPTISGLEQSQADGTGLAPGGRLTGDIPVVLRAMAGDADGDALRLEIEVRRAGETFTGAATAGGGWVEAGGLLDLRVLTPGRLEGGVFGWRARTVDLMGGASEWASFGGDDGAGDFEYIATGSFNVGGCGNSAAGSAALRFAALVGLLIPGCRAAKSP